MVSNKLIVAAFAALASVANASPCEPSFTKALTTPATEPTSAVFISKTGSASSDVILTSATVTMSMTSIKIETTVTVSETTTEATDTEAATTVAETATTSTTADAGPSLLLLNTGFEDDTTSPWMLAPYKDWPLTLGNPKEGTASGRIEFGVQNGGQYYNYIYQNINKNALKAGKYRLSGSVRVDYANDNNGDGCSSAGVLCFRGPISNLRSLPNSQYLGGVYEAQYFTVSTTCEFTESLLAQYDEFSVAFSFKCAESGANLDSVIFQEAV